MGRSLIVLLGLAFAGAWAYGQVSSSTQSAATQPPQTPASTAAIAVQLNALERALAQAQQTGKAVAVTLRFTDADLTAAAANASLSSNGVTVRDPAVHVLAGSILVTGTAQMGPFSGDLRVSATPSVSDGHAVISVDTATVSGYAAPDGARTSIQSALQTALATLVPSRLQITSIVAAAGVLTIQATALP